MRISINKLTIALFTLIVGASSAYLLRLVYSNAVTSPVKIAQPELPSPASVIESATTIEDEWMYLIKADVDLNPTVNLPDFVPSLKKDESHAVDFLISHIPDRQLTNVHVPPYGMALRGEVAIYCLQDSWNKPWYTLKKEYEVRVKRILATEPGQYQSYLQSIIKSPKGSKEMMALWRTYYESRTSLAAQK